MAGEHTEIAGVDGRGYVCRSPQCSRKSSSEGTSEQQGDALAESAIGFAGNYGTSRGIPEFPFFKYLYYQQREFV